MCWMMGGATPSTMFAGSSDLVSANVANPSVPPRRGVASPCEDAPEIGPASSREQPEVTASATARIAPSSVRVVERIAQPLSEQVEAEDSDQDGDDRCPRDPWRGAEIVLAFEQHATPRRRRGRDPGAEIRDDA